MHEDYDDDEYDDDEYDYDHPSLNPYYHFKFDVSADNPLFKWIGDMFTNIFGDEISFTNVPGFPVSSWNPDTGKNNNFQYLGSNYANEPIWKTKYLVINPLDIEYKLHIQSHAAYFISQPKYYKGLFEILN